MMPRRRRCRRRQRALRTPRATRWRCGAARRFEFQVLPTLVNHLDVDSELNSAIDFGSIAVYTCSRSCAPAASDGTRGMNVDGKSEAYAEECVLVHPPLNA